MNRSALSYYARTVVVGGWILMIPPINDAHTDHPKVDEETPCCEQWVHYTSHDSAAACEAQRNHDVERLDREMQQLQLQIRKAPNAEETKHHAKLQLDVDFAERSALSDGRCVPADHIYPPKKPTK